MPFRSEQRNGNLRNKLRSALKASQAAWAGIAYQLLGQRHEQLRQPLGQPLHVVDDAIARTEDVADVFVGLRVEVDAIGEDEIGRASCRERVS
jgi:hypothetical protein